MNNKIKIIIKFFLILIIIIFFLLFGIFEFISYLEIKPEYKDLGFFERNSVVKEKFTPCKEDLLKNINFYNNVVNYINENKNFSIFKTNSINYSENDNNINKYEIELSSLTIENTGSYIIQGNGYSFDCILGMNKNGLYFIGNNNYIFNKGIIFLKDSIKYERGHSYGYLYYDGELPVIINKNYKINKFDISIKNWVIFDIQDTLGN